MKRISVHLFAVLASISCLAMDFSLPTSAERLRAIGSTRGLPETLQKFFRPDGDFEPIPVPKPGDWLAEHPESGQSFDEFVRSRPRRPGARRTRIYLMPLGEFPDGESPPVTTLREYGGAYFAMDVEVLPALSISGRGLTTRTNPITGNRQILTGDVLALLRNQLPRDAFCVLAITMEDLYPDPSWNFVFGQASLREGVGVFSFARYDPAFYGQERGKDYHEILLRRSCRVLVHEMAHMFSLEHCTYFRCVLNGSNHLRESDSRPLSLCPVCLRKLHFSIGFEVAGRYQGLLRFYRNIGFDPETRWVENRLRKIPGRGEGI
jgi:archaemetzincin